MLWDLIDEIAAKFLVWKQKRGIYKFFLKFFAPYPKKRTGNSYLGHLFSSPRHSIFVQSYLSSVFLYPCKTNYPILHFLKKGLLRWRSQSKKFLNHFLQYKYLQWTDNSECTWKRHPSKEDGFFCLMVSFLVRYDPSGRCYCIFCTSFSNWDCNWRFQQTSCLSLPHHFLIESLSFF